MVVVADPPSVVAPRPVKIFTSVFNSNNNSRSRDAIFRNDLIGDTLAIWIRTRQLRNAIRKRQQGYSLYLYGGRSAATQAMLLPTSSRLSPMPKKRVSSAAVPVTGGRQTRMLCRPSAARGQGAKQWC